MEILKQLKTNWQTFSLKKRVATLLFLGSVATGIILLSWYMLVPRYVPLFTNLDSEQAYKISEALRRDNLPFKLEAAGTTITVPEKQVHEIRIRVAGEGLYNTGVGFELFDGVKLGITDFERRLNYQRALEEELRRTIVQFSEIDQARVHLVIPEPSLFQGSGPEPTASVAVKLHPLRTLNAEQVRSLIYLVSMSVPNLSPENVTLVDMSGKILGEKIALKDQDTLGLSASQLELKRNFEEEMEARLLRMLERVFGPGKVVAMISADLDFDHSTVTQITYDKDNAVLRSEHVIREKSQGSNPDGGEPGTGSNVPVYPEEGENGEYTYEREEHTKNWEIGSSETTVVTAPGKVQRLSASITVSANLTDDEKEELRAMVGSAMGADALRGDQVTVSGISFNTEHLDENLEDLDRIRQWERIQQYLSYGLKGLGLILGFIMVLVISSRLMRPVRRHRQDEPEPVLAPLETIAVAKETAAATRDESEMDYIRDLIINKPGEVAKVMRAWVHEE